MRTFSDEYFGDHNQRILDDSIYMFEESLESLEGFDIIINNKIKTRAYITNNINEYLENKEMRAMSVRNEIELEKGDYIYFEDKIWIILTDIDNHNSHKRCKIVKCNRVINLPDCPKQYAYADDSSYGQKGIVNSTLMTYADGQVKLSTQNNEYTKSIPLGYRLIFGNDKNMVYEVTKNDIITTEASRIIMLKKTDYDSRYDLKNNIAYNEKKLEFDEDYENPRHNEIYYIIKDTEGYYHGKYCPDGYDLELCKRDCTKIYICDELENDLSDIEFNITSNIDIVNKYDSSVEIVSQGNNYIEVKNLYGYNGNDFIITFEKDNIKIPIKIKLSR